MLMKKAKFILLAMIALFTLEGCGSKVAKTDVEKANLKGKVKYMAEYRFDLEVDENGYDIKTPKRFWSKEGGRVDYIEYYYKKDGMLDKYVYVCDNYLCFNSVNYEKERVVNIFHLDNKWGWHTEYVYDENGRIEKTIEQTNEVSYKYDSKGNLIKDGDAEYVVDEFGRIIETKYPAYTICSKYDEKGNEIECQFISDKRYQEHYAYVDYTAKMKYNDKGDIIEREQWSADGSHCKYIYFYSYDNYGNWTSKSENEKIEDKLVTIERIERNIIYYGEDNSAQTMQRQDDPEFRENIKPIIEDLYYFHAKSAHDLLKHPEIRDYLLKKYSQEYYDLAIKHSKHAGILRRDVGGYYTMDYQDYNGNGISIFINDSYMSLTLFLEGYRAEEDGTLSYKPWKKGYETDEFGDIDKSWPYYQISREFSRNGLVPKDVMIRIDGDGLKLACKGLFSNTTKVRIKMKNGEVFELPMKYYSDHVLHLYWSNEDIYPLLKIMEEEYFTMSISTYNTVFQETYTYTADFSGVDKTLLVARDLLREHGVDIDFKEMFADYE